VKVTVNGGDVAAAQADGCDVTTIEGLSGGGGP
jgi:aerobic-type carbon monoxide dehydrogenase small subunit (CoxS/CutS family)